MAKPTKPIDDELNIYTAVNKIVEIYADSFKFRNDRKAAETSLVKMGAVIQQLITADRKQLLDRVEKEAFNTFTERKLHVFGANVLGLDDEDHEDDEEIEAYIAPIKATLNEQRTALAKLRKDLGL